MTSITVRAQQPPPSVSIVPCEGERWMVARTMARCEKKLGIYCERLSIPYYLPLRRSVRRYAHRVVEFMVPIFTGYVFVRLPIARKGVLDESRYVAATIVPDEQMERTLIGELNDLHILEQATLSGDMIVRPEIQVGRDITIHTGPLAGMHGVVVRRKSHARLSVNIEMIGQSVSVELDVGEVEIEW